MFNNKHINMLISLILAVALWAYVAGEVNPSQSKLIRDIPVQLENQQVLTERNMAIATADPAVDVTVKGSRKALADLGPKDFTATADVSECIAGDNVIEVRVDTDKEVIRETDTTITIHITVEEIVSAEKTVRAEYAGKEKADLDISLKLLSDDTVTVTGARSAVDRVAYVRAAVKDISSPETEAKLTPVDERGETVENVTLSSKTARVSVAAFKSKSVKLEVDVKGKPAKGYSYDGIDFPEKITISGSADALDGISGIKAESIDITGFTKTKKIELKLKLPDGVSLSSDAAAPAATVKISRAEEQKDKDEKEKKTAEAVIGSDEITLEGLMEGFSAEVVSGDMIFSIEGIEEADSSDFNISADLSGLEAGEHTLAPDIEYSGEGTVKSGPDEITVVIKEETEE